MRMRLPAVLSTLVVLLGLVATITPAAAITGPTPVFINEIHYDNADADVGESVEVAGPAGTDLAGWTLVLYNGSNGTAYGTTALVGVLADSSGGYGFSSVAISGLQNGSPDGIALVDPSNAVVQFLSYEGAFTATDGPAAGLTSTDIGVAESGTTPVGESLQLTGSGTVATDFTWAAPAVATPGAANNGQIFTGAVSGPPPVISEVMFNPASAEDDWEWIEIHNPDSVALDLSGWVVDDINGTAVVAPNIAAGSIPAGGSGVLFNVDDVSAADFEAAWGTGMNLIPVTGWGSMGLNNGGDTIGLWEDAAAHTADQDVHDNAVVSVAYDGSFEANGQSVHLANLSDNASWAGSSDGGATPVGTGYLSMAAAGNIGAEIGSPGGTFAPPTAADPVISELMFNPRSSEDDWEWIELHNPGGVAIDLAGWVVDDFNTSAHLIPNIAAGSIPAGGSAILFNVDDVSAANFEAAWGTGINLVPVTNWSAMALNNGGDTVGLWADFASYDGDNVDQLNAVVSVAYDGTIDDGDGSVHLTDLTDQNSFALSTDGLATPVGVGYTAAPAGGNSGADIGSPGGTITGAELLFTQYVEGSSSNKAIEIANLGTTAVSLDGYTLELYSNGSPTATTSTVLTGFGSVPANDVFVLYNSGADPDIVAVGDATASAVNWNGDDAVALRNPGRDLVDVIGQIGVAPASGEWGDATAGTQNDTLCRNSDITVGDGDGSDVFDPSVEWTGLGEDVFTGLGEIGCEADPVAQMVKIHEVQGSGPASPLDGQFVEVQGIVTSLLEDNDAPDGFFLQEEDADADADPVTSEGVFIFCRGACPTDIPVAVGDLVTATGVVDEFFDMTQIETQTGSIVIDSRGIPLPSASAVSLPAGGPTDAEATFENLEGMLVTIADKLVISEYFQLARYGELTLTLDERPQQFTDSNAPSVAGYAAFLADLATRRIILDDNNNDQNDATTTPDDNEPYPHPDGGLSTTNRFRGGDSITDLTGVMHWSFAGQTGTDAWRIRKTDGVDYTFTEENARTSVPDAVGGSITVASFNVLNYFLTLDQPGATCGPSSSGCRGANSASELTRQRDKIISALVAMNADVVGLIEIENDAGAAVADLVSGLNAELGAGTYDYVDTGTIGGDAIKVAFIYKPGTVSLAGQHAILDSSVDSTFIDTKNRPALIQTFEEVASGERVTVAVNHLKSKGSACDDVGDPGLDDGQANCNLTRTSAATALANYLATDPTGSGDDDFLIMGDLNAYAMEDPITALEGAGYTDLVEQFAGGNAYSFLFDGQLGYLDHAMANPALAPQVTGLTTWHINADEAPLLDYNDDIQDSGEQPFERESNALDIYDPDQYRSSDHDPVIIGLDLTGAVDPATLCNGLEATILGTEGRDRIFGTPGDDVIVTLGGNDFVNGRGGDDVICTGDGDDVAIGSTGDDTIFGQDGRDRLVGQSGDDMLDGGPGKDNLSGGSGDDVMLGGADEDRMSGGNGDDEMDGGTHDDNLSGNNGDDTITGGEDDDRIFGGGGLDNLSGGDGNDLLRGGSQNDVLDGGADTDNMNGNGGTDTCTNGEVNNSCEL